MMETGFGELLRRYRVAAGLTQEELAERAGLSTRGISDLERGARGLPRKDTLQLLLRALDVSPSDRDALVAAARRPPTPTVQREPADGPAGLPVPLTPLIGREAELATVSTLLRDPAVRLLTLVGPGGTGKTRLALAVAERAEPDFADGVIFVPLAPLADPSFVAAAIAQGLGVREAAGQSLVDRLKAHLAGKRVLLVLDNFEHLIPATALVADLLGGGSSLKVLTTSRTLLRLSGEHTFPVPPLDLPRPDRPLPLNDLIRTASVRLFVDRVRAVRADFTLNDADAPAVAEIVRRLDGLPLALELAAARARLLSPAALLARLERRLPLLTGGPLDLPDRQRTLRDTIAWSHDLLTPQEQTLFRCLGVFAGGWTLDAAAAVADADDRLDVLEAMTSLLDKNLVRHADRANREPRLTMLETIREFALEQLRRDAGEADAVERAHAAWCLALATAVAPSPRHDELRTALDRLTAEYDNLRVALVWFSDHHDAEALARLVGSLAWFWHWTAYGREGLTWTERALGGRAGASPAARTDLLTGAAVFLARMGDHERATALGEELLALARDARDQEAEASAWFLLSRAANQRAAHAEAMTFAQKAVALFRALGPTSWLPWTLQRLGIEAHVAGDQERAAALFAEALARFRTAGNALGTAYVLGNLGLVRHHAGVLQEAAALYRESLSLHRDMDDPWETASVLGRLAALAAGCGHAERVARLLGAAHGLYQRSGTVLQPYVREDLDHADAGARARLGPEAYAAAWEAGRRLSLGEAIGEGLAAAEAVAEAMAISATPAGDAVPVDAATPGQRHRLTPREVEVLRLLAAGHSNPAIAEALFISPRTAQTHVQHILDKLDVGSRAEAAAYAATHGLLN